MNWCGQLVDNIVVVLYMKSEAFAPIRSYRGSCGPSVCVLSSDKLLCKQAASTHYANNLTYIFFNTLNQNLVGVAPLKLIYHENPSEISSQKWFTQIAN